jgi:hypothetical protein
MSTTTTIEAAVLAFEQANETYASALTAEMALSDQKPLAKDGAIRRIMAAQGGSYTSAERTCEADREYADFLSQLRQAVHRRILAYGAREVAIMVFQAAATTAGAPSAGFLPVGERRA